MTKQLLLTLLALVLVTVGQGIASEKAEAVSHDSDVFYYLGFWEWENRGVEPFWQIHSEYIDVVTGIIDMRSIPQMSLQGTGNQCCALISLSEQRTDITLMFLGAVIDGIQVTGDGRDVDTIATALGVDIDSVEYKEIIHELLLDNGDPTGQTKWKPVIPNNFLDYNIILGNKIIVDDIFSDQRNRRFNALRDVPQIQLLRNDYELLRTRVIETTDTRDDDEYLKRAGYYEVKYNLDIRSETQKTRDGELVRPTSSVVDDFDVASNTDIDVYGDWSDCSDTGTWDGVLTVESADDRVHSDQDGTDKAHCGHNGFALSGVDQYVEIVTQWAVQESGTTTRWAGVLTRKDNSADRDGYAFLVSDRDVGDGDDETQLGKRIGGSFTSLVTGNPTVVVATDYTVRLETLGSSIEGFIGGVSQISSTDTSITSGSYTGFVNYSKTETKEFDDFEASDIFADILIDAAVHSQSYSQAGDARRSVWSNETTGYIFYIEDGSTSDFVYKKTTDSGFTWSSVVEIEGTSTYKFDIWYEDWTQFDGGGLIHIAWLDNDDELNYSTLDTSDDTLSTEADIVTGLTVDDTIPSNYDNIVSIVKAVDGALYIQFWANNLGTGGAGLAHGFYKCTTTCTTAGNWSSVSDGADGDLVDGVILYPSNSTDGDDVWMLYLDYSALEITIKVYDQSADSWASETFVDTIIYIQSADMSLNGGVLFSDENLYFAWHDKVGSLHSELTFGKFDGTTFTQISEPRENVWRLALVAILINQNNDDIYIGFVEGVENFRDFVYIKTDDLGVTWDDQISIVYQDADDIKGTWFGQSIDASGGMFYGTWFNDDVNDIFGSPVDFAFPIVADAVGGRNRAFIIAFNTDKEKYSEWLLQAS